MFVLDAEQKELLVKRLFSFSTHTAGLLGKGLFNLSRANMAKERQYQKVNKHQKHILNTELPVEPLEIKLDWLNTN